MRRVVAVALLVLAGVLVGAGVIEIFLRLTRPAAPDLRALHLAEPTQPWLYRLRPGAEAELDKTAGIHYRVNGSGFRGPRYPQAREGNAFRVAVLGDSLTFGFGVQEEEIYTALLEAELTRLLAPRKVQVLNFGVGGYNPYNEVALFEGIGAAYQPDLVLIQFCINDLNDPRLHFDAHTLRLLDLPDDAFPDPRMRALPMPEKSPLAFCAGRLRLCDLLQHALYENRADRRVLAQTVAERRTLGDAERAWLHAQYGKLAQWATAHGAGFGVVVFPYPKQLRDPSRDGVAQGIAALGRDDRFAVIDLTPAFRAASPERVGPLFLDLWHPSPAGHQVAADALAAELVRQGLVPAAQGVGAR
jgi:lysophospholipase L1-like esterase